MDNTKKLEIINYGLLSLKNEKEITIEFYQFLLDMVKKSIQFDDKVILTAKEHDDSVRSDTADLIEYLMMNNVDESVKSENDMRRLYKKYKTMKSNPEGYEVWKKISAALLSLEEDNLAERREKDLKYTNSNLTEWRLKDCNCYELIQIHKFLENAIKELPFYHCKRHDSILTPIDAKDLTLRILRLADGYLQMKDIVLIAKRRVEISHTVSAIQKNGDGEEYNIIDESLSVEDITREEVFAEESSEYRTKLIWDKIQSVSRGTVNKIEGSRIFCLYLLPSTCGSSKVNLDDFGPSSTVGDIINKDIYPLLRKYLYFDNCGGDSTYTFIGEDIQKKIISKLNGFCSEKGYNTGLDL